jgi:hypothetical protein
MTVLISGFDIAQLLQKLGHRVDDGGIGVQFPEGAKYFSFLSQHPESLLGPHSLLSSGYKKIYFNSSMSSWSDAHLTTGNIYSVTVKSIFSKQIECPNFPSVMYNLWFEENAECSE